MEKRLKLLFDYQRFEQNERLAALVKSVKSDSARKLDDSEAGLVNAAGDGSYKENEPTDGVKI